MGLSRSRELCAGERSSPILGRGESEDYYSVYLDRQRIAKEGVDLGGYELVMDEESMRGIVDEIARVVDKAPSEPYITILNRVGGGKPGVGVGGDASDIYTTKTVNAPDGKPMADIQFHNGKNGYVLNREDMVAKIVNAFYAGDYNAELVLDLEETEPSVTAQQLSESMQELSRFHTVFQSSSDARARNVQKAAGLLHCTIMLPSVDYSYNEILGPRYEKDGWLPAPGIAGGREYIDSPGGGICQVSTTRASGSSADTITRSRAAISTWALTRPFPTAVRTLCGRTSAIRRRSSSPMRI